MNGRSRIAVASLLVSLGLISLGAQRTGRIGKGGKGRPSAQVTALPLLHQASFADQGAFRVPQGSPTAGCGDDLQFGGVAIAYNPAGNSGAGSLYLQTYNTNTVELSIPTLVNSGTLANLNVATCLQSAAEATEGRKAHANVLEGDTSASGQPAGLLVLNGKLWITQGVFYDSGSAQKFTIASRPLTLSTTGSVTGLFGIRPSATGAIGPMAMQQIAAISSDWTAPMGGDVFLSKFAGNIVTAMSYGPAAFVGNTSAWTGGNSLRATTISAASADNSFNDSGAGFPALSAGDVIAVFNSTTPTDPNNGIWTVTSRTASKIVVSGGAVTTRVAGNTINLGVSYPTVHDVLFGTSARGPSGACTTNNGNNVGNAHVQCGDGFGGWPGGTRGSTYKYWSSADFDGQVIQPVGTRTLVVAHVHGAQDATYGGYGYGCGCGFAVATPGQLTCNGLDPGGCGGAGGEGYFYDPEHSSDKGNHGYPYYYQFALYDMADLVSVISGTKDPRDVVPYEYFNWTFPIMPSGTEQTHSAVTYDAANQVIYLAQRAGPDNARPIIHAIKVTP